MEFFKERSRLSGGVLVLFGAASLLCYLWAAFERSGPLVPGPVFAASLLVLSAGPLLLPRLGALGVFFLIPFFGNFPGGRWMEVLNISLAAGVVGLTLRARREGLPPPRGRLWLAASVSVAAAALAFIPSLEGVLPRLFQINSLPEAVVETLTARETDPLYSLSSLVLLALAAAWAYTLAWASVGTDFARKALRCVAMAFLFVVALGALDLHGVLDLQAPLRRIDPRSVSYEGFQSIFWNAGWFSWYFVMAFGLVMGLIWVEALPAKLALGAVLAISYVYSFGNPQRGGFLALHAALVAALIYLLVTSRARKRNLALAAAALFGAAALAVIAYRSVPKPEVRGSAWTRLTSGVETDTVRKNLAVTAWRMTSEYPLFGIGEGAFAWRWADYAPKEDPPRPDPAFGDAHNTFLQILATRGVLGLASYLVLLLFLGRRILRAAGGSGPERGIALGLTFSLTAFLTYSFVQNMFYLQAIQALFWGIVALAAIVSPEEREPRPLSRRARWLLAAAGLGALALQLSLSWPRLTRGAARAALEPRGFSGLEIWGTEGPMRWSSRRGTLCAYPTAPVARLRFVAIHPDLWADPLTVSIRSEGRLLDRFELDRAVFRERSLLLPETVTRRAGAPRIPFGQCVEGERPLRLAFEVERTWSPFSWGLSGDSRHLGVAVFQPSFSPATRPQAGAKE